ncbi:hypothetical protein [Roseofilum sp. Guam]|uniref:hypothetical protein n=1 Tax=Roseofilum sp. Guam TaxID=2821502 RepID=UPI001B2544A7|nr:hypothetical protein [Roseofilum sp. Guam]MBP0028214.1 hypothetical protein [Roseofilum sp. Guam]
MRLSVYAPNVHLFAFQLCKTVEDSDRSAHLWNYYNRFLVDEFKLSYSFFPIATVEEERRINLWNDPNQDNILLPLEGILANQTKITGCACPLLIYDSYALALNLRIPEKDADHQPTQPVPVEIFQEFNPHQCFCPQKINSNLGQTILLTAWLLEEQKDKHTQWQSIAESILKNFLNDQNPPHLYQSGHLFGSPIYEFGSPKYPNQDGKIEHYLVWLFLDDAADQNLGDFYQEIVDLCFYRNKVTTAYQQSRLTFTKVKKEYCEIKDVFSSLSEKLPDQNQTVLKTYLEELKKDLRTLPKLNLDYTDQYDRLTNWHLTIQINRDNYAEKIDGIQRILPDEDLSILSIFNTKIAKTLEDQIKGDLGYFDQGSYLVDKAIATIRGLVEIEQAESDRKLQEQNQALQDHIQAIGFGIAAGAIVASTSGLMTEPWDFPNPKQLDLQFPLPFLIALVGSFLCSFSAWKLARRWIKHQRNLEQLKSSQEKYCLKKK